MRASGVVRRQPNTPQVSRASFAAVLQRPVVGDLGGRVVRLPWRRNGTRRGPHSWETLFMSGGQRPSTWGGFRRTWVDCLDQDIARQRTYRTTVDGSALASGWFTSQPVAQRPVPHSKSFSLS